MLKKNVTNDEVTVINIIVGAISYVATFGVNFWLSPYIVNNIGIEAVGFVDLANNFINYALLITIALNTLSGRFVSISIHRNDNKNANEYFSSVFFSNIILSVVLALIGTVSIIFLESLFDISQAFVIDVKVLFGILFLNCILSTVGSVFSIAAFTTNKLYLGSFASLAGNIVRAFLLIGMFTIFIPKLYYVGVASVVATLVSFVLNVYFTKKLLPTIKLTPKDFRFEKVKELTFGGIWAAINRVGIILLTDLDLLISNIFIDSFAMGVLSVSKTIPNAISGVVTSAAIVFSPNYTRLYAQEKYEELVKYLKQTMKIMGFLTNIPIIVLICCGDKFYSLWQPTIDTKSLYILSILAVGCLVFSGGINCIYSIFTVVNKLKLNAIVVVVSGFISTGLVVVLLETTDLGVYAIAGVSTVVSIIRNLAFTAPYGAKCLNQKWYVFYPDIIKPVVFVLVSSVVGAKMASLFVVEDWTKLVILVALVVILSIAIGFFIMLNKRDRKMLLNIIKEKF